MEIEHRHIGPQTYAYVEVETPMSEIGEVMGPAFGRVFGALAEAGITPVSMPMSVYFGMSDPLRFHAGAMITAEAAERLAGPLAAGTLPGEVVTGVHRGPYDGLGRSHQAMMDWMAREGLTPGMPIWEIYVDDPGDTPAADLRTEIYRAVG